MYRCVGIKHGFRFGVYHHFANISLFKKIDSVDRFLSYVYLFESIRMHKIIAHIVLVKELVGTALNPDFVYFYTGVESFFEDSARLHIFQLGPDKSSPFSRFYMKKFHNRIIGTVNLDAHAVSKICCCCHKKLLIALLIVNENTKIG
ncbi:MAG: hypothetical protein BWX77_00221 [Bacteroidetes bacterium ADurb.Bin090]|nr:MAG: hypothetical protein BWX77_00221 [Bacteroidetes bacterium ADurb.Bin090]